MYHLLNKSIELEALIIELQKCANLMDNETAEFHNTTKLIGQYRLEKIRIDDALEVWNKSMEKSTQKKS